MVGVADICRQMLEAVQRRQRQIEEVWRSRKIQLEQNLQLKIFERAVFKVCGNMPLGGGGDRI